MTDDRTADGKPITDGMICYDNNLGIVRVHLDDAREENGVLGPVLWYRTTDCLTGRESARMDGGRLSTTFRDYHGNVARAHVDLLEQYVGLMDLGHDFPWDIDNSLTCGGCGAGWLDGGGFTYLDHNPACPIEAAWDEQEARIQQREGVTA